MGIFERRAACSRCATRTRSSIRSAALLTKVIASAVAEGLQARSGAKTEAEGAEPLAEWEQELLAGATAGTEADAATETTTTES